MSQVVEVRTNAQGCENRKIEAMEGHAPISQI